MNCKERLDKIIQRLASYLQLPDHQLRMAVGQYIGELEIDLEEMK